MITKLLVKNYKILKNIQISLNSELNIFVGQNESGKSTILEAIGIATTGRLHYYPFERQLRANLFNNAIRKEYKDGLVSYKAGSYTAPSLPKIVIEVYLDDVAELALYKGKNNELREDVPGIRVEVSFNDEYADLYCKLLDEQDIEDIPVELYKVHYKYFNGQEVLYRFAPVKSVLIDAGHKNYTHVVSQFINSNIEGLLTDQEKLDIGREYRKSRSQFKKNPSIQKLNAEVAEKHTFDGRIVSVDFQEETVDAWKDQMTVALDDVPFDNVGFGTQNVIKTELAILNSPDKVNILLMEEPENNLSYTNMTRMLEQIRKAAGKQIFIATHSSYVANTLSLKNLFLVRNGMAKAFSNISDDTYEFFQKLPGFDTLRAVLANKIIFVEGPTYELIVKKCYKGLYGNLPIDDGIDVIVAKGLTFKRFCDITMLLKKKVAVITDNDCEGKKTDVVEDKIKSRYEGYYGTQYVDFFVEQNPKLHTIEPSVLAANCDQAPDGTLTPHLEFQQIVNKRNKKPMTFEELTAFMESNKVEWAFRVFESEKPIYYPKNIIDAIKAAREYE